VVVSVTLHRAGARSPPFALEESSMSIAVRGIAPDAKGVFGFSEEP